MLKEFRVFAMRGNVLDLAVAVVIGGAFGKIVSSFVSDILMPPINMLLGNVNFTNLFFTLKGETFVTLEEAKAAGAITWNYGLFLTTLIEFLIIALAIFTIVRLANEIRPPALVPVPVPVPAPATKDCPYCYSPIAAQATRCPQCTSELN